MSIMKPNRIGFGTKWLMLGTAIALDILAVILAFFPVIGEVANEYIGMFGNFMFLVWFWSKGISPLKKKRAYNFILNWIGELVSFGIWPGFTVMVATTIYMHNKEVSEGENAGGETRNK